MAMEGSCERQIFLIMDIYGLISSLTKLVTVRKAGYRKGYQMFQPELNQNDMLIF